MSKLFSEMLEEMGFKLPAGRERFNRPMPTRSTQTDINPDPNVPDTGITSMGSSDDNSSSDMSSILGDPDQLVNLIAKALQKLIGGGLSSSSNDDTAATGTDNIDNMDDSDRLSYDDLPDEDDLFGDPDGDPRAPRNGGLGSLSSEEDGKLSSEEDFQGNMTDDSGAPTSSGEDDPDRQGDIRNIKGARLSFKRQQPDGTFSEMWIYNVGEGLHDTLAIKRAILAGTDIPENQFESDDGKQRYQIATLGNAQVLKIEGILQ